MGQEIERKFLVKGEQWPKEQGTFYRQGYLSTEKERSVRVRLLGDKKAYLTIKGDNDGASRLEFEYELPFQEAETILEEICLKPVIEKKRYKVEHEGLTWEIDEFFGENEGLVLAEVELDSENEAIKKPDWVGEDVTDDPRYYNANLVHHPFRRWS